MTPTESTATTALAGRRCHSRLQPSRLMFLGSLRCHRSHRCCTRANHRSRPHDTTVRHRIRPSLLCRTPHVGGVRTSVAAACVAASSLMRRRLCSTGAAARKSPLLHVADEARGYRQQPSWAARCFAQPATALLLQSTSSASKSAALRYHRRRSRQIVAVLRITHVKRFCKMNCVQ